MVLGWDKLKKLLSQAFTWTGTQTFTDIVISGGLSLGAASQLSGVLNADVDTGTENIDSFADTEGNGAIWDYAVVSGANVRTGRVMAAWDAGTDAVVYSESSTADVGDTSGVVFTVDINSNNVRLRCTVASDNWAVYATRNLLG